MKMVLILQGLPASGKSTFAKKLVEDSQGAWKRLNKDDLRAMLDHSIHSPANEAFVEQLRDLLLLESLKAGKNVVIDDTNLWERPIERIQQVVAQYNAEYQEQVEINFRRFDTPVEECIRRDSTREKKVGREVIMKMYRQHIVQYQQQPFYQAQDESLPKAIICDLDGTLALVQHRQRTDYRLCHTDGINQPIADLLTTYAQLGYAILLLSDRPETVRQATHNWLQYNRIAFDKLLLRPLNDTRKETLVKKDLYQQLKDHYCIAFVLDDRPEAVDCWRLELGLPCLQVNYGD